MSLRIFHLVFIAISVVLTAFVAAWSVGQYRLAGEPGYIAVCAAAVAAGIGLVVYATRFQRKTRSLS